MDLIAMVYMPILGLAVGSFLNLSIDRVHRGHSVLSPRSKCDSCERFLASIDLIPVISYLWLRGRCRYCGAGIPRRVPVVEVISGAFFGLVVSFHGLTPLSGIILAYGSLFLVIAAIDLERTIIPNVLVFPGILLAFAAAPWGFAGEERGLGETYWRTLAGGGLGLGLMLLIFLTSLAIYKSNVGFGFGDVKLGALLGLILGFPEVAIGLYFAFLSGGVVGITLLLTGAKGRKDSLPYGPFLAGGALVTLLIGESLGWYLHPFR